MEPVILVAWKIGETFLHRVLIETYQRVGWYYLRGRRIILGPRMRYILAGPVPEYARSLLTATPSLADAMREPRLGPVLSYNPTTHLDDLPEPLPTPLDNTQTQLPGAGALVLFLAVAGLMVYVAHRVHRRRQAVDRPEATAGASTDPVRAPAAASTDPVHAPAAAVLYEPSEFWFAFVMVVFAMFTVG
ncbi:hypothetical protein ZWY2020_024586 [Hordeum vulgare]|nr:hypothetical protein ZWY2020_024586 [Hordeum vulgare]